ncbi:hypothetical protein UMM65_14360 [Aureibaculum sp. 2210JD6-5]|uniref:hypothetical protein n=1 Tax=Aureibaculum sp. 2210JD6-5 TaxID=3103957 RepID=UPI002AACA3F4|nr:hypothetical protein [Aureibaculum sp. 2210JD6-5]MDY7396430.1 hypothetical protein [Aureibaculum sp. 2210JD6-5]
MKQILFIAVCTLTLISCGREIPSDFDYGKIENNKYTNDFFGHTMDIPEGWFIQDEQTQKQLSEEGAKALGGEKLAKTVKAAEITSANLLMASQFDIATHSDPNVMNANFTLVAENLGIAGISVNDGNAYLEASKKQFTKNNVPIVVNGDTKTMDVDGKTFHYFDAVMTMQGMKINQRYMATVINGFALLYVATYGTDDQLEKLMDVLKTSDFK